MTEPKITVIIPTRERCETLEKSLLTVTKQRYDNLEIIVSDNCSGDRTKEIVFAANDRRVRYLNTQRRISMSQNWEFALSHVDTGWVTIIGDDDGLLPESLSKVAAIIGATDAKAIRSSVCSYFWPSAIGKDYGHLGVPMQNGHEIRNAAEWLRKVLDGDAEYQQLPMLYNGGYVDVRVLNEIRKRTGSIYRSCVPDIYSAISIASTVDRYIYCREPLAINGASKHSTGTSYFSSQSGTNGSPAHLFASEGNMPFHADFPAATDGRYSLSIQAMVYESYLQSAGLRSVAPDDMHARMLTIILAASGPYEPSVEGWGKRFALMHHLNFASIFRKARFKRLRRRVKSVPRLVSAAMNRYVIGSRECPVEDVYTASVAAAAVRKAGIGIFKRILHLFCRAIEMAKLHYAP
jgi:glycosyltransferase involved in cell wall biosynthesis